MRSGGDSGPLLDDSWYLGIGIAWGPVFGVGGLRRNLSWQQQQKGIRFVMSLKQRV